MNPPRRCWNKQEIRWLADVLQKPANRPGLEGLPFDSSRNCGDGVKAEGFPHHGFLKNRFVYIIKPRSGSQQTTISTGSSGLFRNPICRKASSSAFGNSMSSYIGRIPTRATVTLI